MGHITKKTSRNNINAGPMFNAYPDSIGRNMEDIIKFLQQPELKGVFQSFYILPSVFNSDLDRGFSIIDYNLNAPLARQKDLEKLRKMGISLKFDFVLNHLSVLSKQFQDILNKGTKSDYLDFFIRWNKFWEGRGKMTDDGYIQPDGKYIKKMFFRKKGLPFLKVRLCDGREIPYWNTFYQEVKYEKLDAHDLTKAMNIQFDKAQRISEIVNQGILDRKKPESIDLGEFEPLRNKITHLLKSNRKYLGQMDLNVKSPLVWEFYEETLKKLAEYGAEIVRLDAFAYASKEPGAKNFLNDPETWKLLERLKILADRHNLMLLPEIHTKYEEKIHEKISRKGYLTYDFFLPGLLIDAMERNTNEIIIKWIKDIQEKGIKTVNMLGCHDGIPLLDLKGLISDDQIQMLINTVVKRGGYVKDIYGKKNMYYQVNATYYSALGESDAKLLLARAIQIFMPGKPQVWYLDLLAGKNDYHAVKKAGPGGHKEINRTNLALEEAIKSLHLELVQKQLSLLKFRNDFPAFGFDAKLEITNSEPEVLKLRWENNACISSLEANLKDMSFSIVGTNQAGIEVYRFIQKKEC
jgi:sucrose phosphorylase